MKYIISLKWTHKNDAFITLWSQNDSGYQWEKQKAGKYDIKNYKNYCNNGKTTLAIDEKKLEPLWIKSVLYGNNVEILPNTVKTRKVLGILKNKFIKQFRSDCPHINIFKS